ncbi:ABC transporter substrate-binding protein [Halomarina salina]|uniref:ABC transporter substrate-binding protein n=1 Tax=Halomarina salina TaxID=1872699 RepID=A0ABD5RSQ1_9EURY
MLRRIGTGATAGGLIGLAGCTSEQAGGGDGGGGGGGSGGGTEQSNGSSSNESGGGGSGTASIKVGFLYPLSGPYSSLGEYQAGGTDVALERISSERDVTVENAGVVDTKLDPTEGLRRARELTEQKNVDVLVGTNSSAVAAAVSEHAKQTETPLVITGASAEPLTGENCNRYTFRTIGNTYQNTRALAEWSMENLGKTVATMGADYSWGRASVGGFVEVAEENGGEVVEQVWPKLGATDYSTEIQKVAGSDADLVCVRAAGSDAVNAAKQMSSFGLMDQMDVLILNSVDVMKGAGAAAVGTYGAGYYFERDTEANRAFVNEYMEMNGGAVPDTWSTTAYSATRLTAKAAAETGASAGSADSAALVSALEGMSVEGPTGETRLRECDHQATANIDVSKTVESTEGWWGEKSFPTREILTTSEAGENARPCEESQCSLTE